eukprot:4401829-Amphidinium_carterae.2
MPDSFAALVTSISKASGSGMWVEEGEARLSSTSWGTSQVGDTTADSLVCGFLECSLPTASHAHVSRIPVHHTRA